MKKTTMAMSTMAVSTALLLTACGAENTTEGGAANSTAQQVEAITAEEFVAKVKETLGSDASAEIQAISDADWEDLGKATCTRLDGFRELEESSLKLGDEYESADAARQAELEAELQALNERNVEIHWDYYLQILSKLGVDTSTISRDNAENPKSDDAVKLYTALERFAPAAFCRDMIGVGLQTPAATN